MITAHKYEAKSIELKYERTKKFADLRFQLRLETEIVTD